ncbi:MAG: DUF2922 domain-containing protein [Anaerovibrio sp.]|nr:DUF2922 domain-containing protein [Anaerovibrio sp.]
MASTLNMVFTRGSAAKTIALSEPRRDLTGAEVHDIMQTILDRQIFLFAGDAAQLDGIKRAYIRENVVTELPEG